MVENWIIEQTVELTRPIQPYVGQPVELMLPGDHLAHTLRIKCKERDMPVNLTGYTAAGYFKRTDGNTVFVVGSITGNVVDVTLTQECYAFAGNLRGVVRITNSTTNAKITLCDRLFHVGQAVDDGGTIDPGEVIPSLDDLLAEIEAMEQATAAAEAAAECIADNYNANATYAVGDYTLHNGGLYRCTTAITSAETWTPAHWTQVVLGGEVKDLNSEIHRDVLAQVTNSKPIVLAESWSAHNIKDTGEVNPAENPKVISTEFYPLSETCGTRFTGVTKGSEETSNRMISIYCYDKNKSYLGRISPGNSLQTGTCFVRFLYDFLSSASQTISSYGLSNMISDWSMEFITENDVALSEIEDDIDNIKNEIRGFSMGEDIYFVDDNNNIGAIIRQGFDSGVSSKTGAKYISILGDSISTYGATGYKMPEANAFYPRYDVESLNDMWYMKVANKIGAKVLRSASWAGSSVRGNTADTTGQAGVSDARINYLGTETINPDIIIVAIGTNDFNGATANNLGTFDKTSTIPDNVGTITQFAPAYALMLSKIHAKYPLAVVYCCTIMARRSSSSVDEFEYPVIKNGFTIDDYNDVIRNVAKLMNCKVIETTSCGMNYWNISTGEDGSYSDRVYGDNYIHPAKKGMDYIANTVFNSL